MTEHSKSAGGVALKYSVTGDGGVPVLLLHGFTGSAQAMAPLHQRLAADRLVVAPDLVGHGRSDAPSEVAPYTADAQVAQLCAVLDGACGPGPVDVVGYSMGARLGLCLAVARPALVRRVVLIGGTAGIDDDDQRQERRAADAALAHRIEAEGIVAFVQHWESIPLFGSQRSLPEATQAAIRAGRLAQRPHGLANSLRGFGTGTMPSLWSSLPGLLSPTLAIVGGADDKYSEVADEMVELIPSAGRATITGVGHAAHVEAPDRVAGVAMGALDA